MNRTSKMIGVTAFALAMVVLGGGYASAQTLKEQDAAAKAQYQAAQKSYQNAVGAYTSARQGFLSAKDKYQQSKNAQDKTTLEQKAKEFLSNAVTAVIRRLEALRNKIEHMPNISEADRAALIAEIDNELNWLKDRQTKISIATPVQLKEEAKTVREYWKNIRVVVKRVTGEAMAARINAVIAKADGFSVRISAKITELKAAGKDTAQLEVWLADFDQKVVLAKGKYAAAKAKFAAISSLADADKLFREGHQFIKDADQYIKQAHAQLVQIVKEMKKIGVASVVPATGEVTTTQ